MAILVGLLSGYRLYDSKPLMPRFEILNGHFVPVFTPGTRHQLICLRTAAALLRLVEAEDLGLVFQAPFNVVLCRRNVIQPDIVYIRKERMGILTQECAWGPPDLVVEVISQDTRQRDAKIKKKIYAEFKIPEYWIIDPASETVQLLLWSEIGYLCAGVYGSQHCLSSPLMPLNIPLCSIFDVNPASFDIRGYSASSPSAVSSRRRTRYRTQ